MEDTYLVTIITAINRALRAQSHQDSRRKRDSWCDQDVERYRSRGKGRFNAILFQMTASNDAKL
jgi:hypothetical protein